MSSEIELTPAWSSNLKMNLAMFSYATGLTIPKIASPWLLKTKIGSLLLIPIQILVTFVVTIPCLFMELALGQYSNKATIRIWDLCPVFRGIGFCSFITFILYQIYYTFLSTCTLCFTILSLTSDPQWKSCNKSWNKMNCYTQRDNYTRRIECYNKYTKEKCDKMQWQTSIEQFYFNRILNVDDSSIGSPQQELLLYSFITLVLVLFANYAGPKSTEKFLIALAIIPTVQLIFLLFAPLTNNGFITLNYFFTNVDKAQLTNFKTWTTIVDLSLSVPGLGFGAYITFGTYSPFRNSLHLRAVATSLINVLFTILHNIALENFLISLCLESKMLLDDLFDFDSELEMPDAVFFLEHSSKFWMTMWLSNSYMLVLSGLRSLIVMMTLNAEIIYNSFPEVRRRHSITIFFFSVIIYCGGIFLSTRIGYFVVKIVDEAVNRFISPFLNFFQLVAVTCFYGIRRFRDDVHFMIGIRPSVYFTAVYIFNSIFLGSVLIYNLYDIYHRSTYFRSKWFYNFENCLIWIAPGMILCFAFIFIVGAVFGLDFRIFKPSENWVPRDTELAKSRKVFKAYNMAKEYLYRQERFGPEFSETEF